LNEGFLSFLSKLIAIVYNYFLGIGGGGGNFFPVLAFEGAVDIFFVPEFLTTLPGLGGLGGAGGAGGRDGADEGF